MAKFKFGDYRETALPRYIIDQDGRVLGEFDTPLYVSLTGSLADVIGRVGLLVGGEDVSNANPVPVSDAERNLSVDFGGVVAQLDDVDKLAVSAYGTDDEAGDTAMRLNAGRQLYVVQEDTFQAMLWELKKISFQLALITGTPLESGDVEA